MSKNKAKDGRLIRLALLDKYDNIVKEYKSMLLIPGDTIEVTYGLA